MTRDAAGNETRARFDALGMVAGTAVMGKAEGPVEGDSFDDFVTDLARTEIKRYFAAEAPRDLAVAHLGTATTRVIYDLDQVPACAWWRFCIPTTRSEKSCSTPGSRCRSTSTIRYCLTQGPT
jgi:hypothetical protein